MRCPAQCSTQHKVECRYECSLFALPPFGFILCPSIAKCTVWAFFLVYTQCTRCIHARECVNTCVHACTCIYTCMYMYTCTSHITGTSLRAPVHRPVTHHMNANTIITARAMHKYIAGVSCDALPRRPFWKGIVEGNHGRKEGS
jgi:hypothetical protein